MMSFPPDHHNPVSDQDDREEQGKDDENTGGNKENDPPLLAPQQDKNRKGSSNRCHKKIAVPVPASVPDHGNKQYTPENQCNDSHSDYVDIHDKVLVMIKELLCELLYERGYR